MSSAKLSEAGLAGELIDLLLDAGCEFPTGDPVDFALANYSPEAARTLITRGCPLGLREAASLGLLDRLPDLFDGDMPTAEAYGTLSELTAAQLIGRAALNTYVLGRHQAVEWLLDKPGDWNVTGVNNGTLLHRAAVEGDLAFVERIVAAGADVNNRDNPFRATPQDWAEHAGVAEAQAWLDVHTEQQMDLWQAARWGKPARIDAICEVDPSIVHATLDVWRYPEITALRMAVMCEHVDAIRTLCARGADPHHIGGDGISVRQAAAQRREEVLSALQ